MPKKQVMFSLRIELFAEAGPLEIDADDLAQDHVEKMKQLIEQLEEVDPQEAADEVYEEYVFSLCAKCRSEMHRGFKEKAKDKG